MIIQSDKNSKSILIDHYEIEDNQIIVYYLDGHYRTEEYTKSKEQEIINKMIKQILDRDNERYSILKGEASRHIMDEIISIAATIGMTYATIFSGITITDWQFIPCIFSIGLGAYAVVYSVELLNEDIKEFEILLKHSIYIKMREQLERIKDSRLYHGIKQPEPLTINTIDKYSYKEVIRVRKNIKTIEKDLFPIEV